MSLRKGCNNFCFSNCEEKCICISCHNKYCQLEKERYIGQPVDQFCSNINNECLSYIDWVRNLTLTESDREILKIITGVC